MKEADEVHDPANGRLLFGRYVASAVERLAKQPHELLSVHTAFLWELNQQSTFCIGRKVGLLNTEENKTLATRKEAGLAVGVRTQVRNCKGK